MNSTLFRSLLVVLPLGLLGCPEATIKPQPIPPAGVVKLFTASPSELAAPGDTATITWETADATAVSIEQVGKGPLAIDNQATGTIDVALTKDALFVLTARGAGGTDSATTSVKVKGTVQGAVFDAVPRSIAPGEATTLVWSAPGAASVTIKEVGGAAIELGGQLQSGSVRVVPTKSTSYELDADGKKLTVAVAVGIEIFSFELIGPAPLPGAMAKLGWSTSGGTRLTVWSAQMAALATETDPAKIASGELMVAVPATAPVDGLLHYTLELERGAEKLSRPLTIRVGGSVKIDSFVLPPFARSNATFVVQWKTTGGERLELWVEDVLTYVAPDAATVAQSNSAVSVPASGTVRVKLVVTNTRGARAESEKTTSVVGPIAFNTFTSNKATIGSGGEAAVLSWNVTNARHVKITESGTVVFEASGPALDTGTATVFPNRPVSTYVLDADNLAGDAIAPQSVAIDVTTPGTLLFANKAPLGGVASISGHNVVGGTTILGLPSVQKNVAGEAFVDISTTGAKITLASQDTTASVVTIGPFSTRVFGRSISTSTVSVSPDGFLVFAATAQTGPSTPSSPPIGTALFPLTLAALYADLYASTGVGEILWQLDTVGDEQRLIVQWNNLARYADRTVVPPLVSTFQIQVFTRGKVVYAYQKLAAGLPAFAVGAVNSTETDVLVPAAAPVAGDVLTFFGEATLPVSLEVEAAPYSALVKVAGGYVEVLGDAVLAPNQIAITELNPRPATGITNGEWIEITNYSSGTFDLNGWTLDLGGGVTHTIGTSLVIAPNARVLLAQVANLGEPGAGITASYTYGTASPTFLLNDASGSITLSIGGAAYSKVTWDSLTVTAEGVSVSAEAPGMTGRLYATGLSQSICASSGATWGAAAQVGTPGSPNGKCFPYTLTTLGSANFESIAASGVVGVLGSTGGTDSLVIPVTLATPIKYYGQNVSTLYVSSDGWLTTTLIASTVTTNRTLPSTTAPVGSISPFWDDLIGNTTPLSSGIFSKQVDPTPGSPGSGDEYTIVSWEDWKVDSTTIASSLNFQVKFFADGAIEYHYGSMTGASGTAFQGSSATSWLEDRFGKSALPINVNSATAPGIQPNSGFRFAYTP